MSPFARCLLPAVPLPGQVFPYVPGLRVVTETRVGGVLLEHVLKFVLTTPVQVQS